MQANLPEAFSEYVERLKKKYGNNTEAAQRLANFGNAVAAIAALNGNASAFGANSSAFVSVHLRSYHLRNILVVSRFHIAWIFSSQ
jgi:hypothetical protein